MQGLLVERESNFRGSAQVGKTFAKKVTLELIYEAVDERTKGLKEDIADLRDDMSKLETKLGGEISELRADVRSINTRLEQSTARQEQFQASVNARFDQFAARQEQFQASVNARFDQIFALLAQIIQQRNGK